MRPPWTIEDCDQNEDQTEIATQVIFDALEDLEYFDWIEHGDAATFAPTTAAMIEEAMKHAHKERKHAALVSLRLLIRLTNEMREELRNHVSGDIE